MGRPVLANGGMFDITASENGLGVECTFQSLDPERTARAIGDRLASRYCLRIIFRPIMLALE